MPIVLIQTKKIARKPVILFGTKYWGGLIDWIKSTMLANGNISETDLDLLHITDDADEVVSIIDNYYKEHRNRPNF
mgnify:CR=1 FL=1